MKKLISLCLIFCMLITCMGCSANPEETTQATENESKPFTVGFGKADVTPTSPVYLGSYNNALQRLSEEIKDNFYATTVAMTDGEGNTLLFIVTDLSWGYIIQTAQVRNAINKEFGIPKDHIMLGGTHNHNGPDWYGEGFLKRENQAYFKLWLEGVMASVRQALEDRQPAVMQVGRTETENLSFVRRYWREDGLHTGDVSAYNPTTESPIVAHETEGDEEIQMVRFVRENGKDILIGQWQSHANHTGNKKIACTDWVGPMREYVETELGCHFLYMQGAAGNMNPSSKIKSEYPTKKDVDQIGKEVGSVIVTAYRQEQTFKVVNTGSIKTKQTSYKGHGADNSDWEGEMNILSIGDLSVVTFPVEMFAELGMDIKKQTPYEMTLLMGYSNGIHGYVPTREAYLNGGYEAHSRGTENTGDEMVAIYVAALKELHG